MSSDSQHIQEFISLLTDHQEVIRTYIISLVPGSPDVRDLLQETNILLWEKKDTFELGTKFGAWACTVAYYKVLDYKKKQKRDGILVFNDDLIGSLIEEASSRSPDLLEAKRRALTHCLSKLSENNRQLLGARYQSTSGDLGQVSTQTGRSRASLRVTLHRLRSGLRDCITKRITMEGGAA